MTSSMSDSSKDRQFYDIISLLRVNLFNSLSVNQIRSRLLESTHFMVGNQI